MIDEFSTSPISDRLLEEIKMAVANKEFGSIEIYIESGRVVQITERIIRKTNKPEAKRPNYVYSRPINKLK
ncbi:MAG: DUF2292 domain-containing protein [bacterium]|nr:DUF2292 domain-containing protein [bacterium]